MTALVRFVAQLFALRDAKFGRLTDPLLGRPSPGVCTIRPLDGIMPPMATRGDKADKTDARKSQTVAKPVINDNGSAQSAEGEDPALQAAVEAARRQPLKR